ncbi:RBBP9/YdeN family alpha/beta hydrolase [Derxia gummosa]|uniref:RBBP9/YdeN family alpha/beta hydrolase n=1 Tax=Derxia gummosa DSM 723 TaxID=1121388 RepID=A0A8B6X634_9BURK|nr:alpha/beta fold hydrolase [Derxia gummosa]
MPLRLLTLPGWQGSGPEHWQTAWEAEHGADRVEQTDWDAPSLDDWIASLDAALAADDTPALLIAHSLGCALAVQWAARSPVRVAQRVAGAFLVAPPDVDRPSAPGPVRGFAPIALAALPFRALVVASTDDPYCGFMRAGMLATHWGAEFTSVGNLGHINADSGIGAWPEGWAMFAAWASGRDD